MLDRDDLSPADEALLEMLQEGRVTAPFAADTLDYSLQYVRDRLGRLVEHGNAEKVYEGLYELVEDPRESRGEAAADATQETTDPVDQGEANEIVDEFEMDEAEAGAQAEADESAEAVLRDLDLPGSGERYEQRVDAVLRIYEQLRSDPGTEYARRDFLPLFEDHDTGYSGGFESLWSNWVKSNPAQGHAGNVLEALPGVEMRGDAYVYSSEGG
jgi:predicted ArsR family transcriptional regulator